MPVTSRFARRRDGSLRLRVQVTGPDVEPFTARVWPAPMFRAVGDEHWQVRVVVEDDQFPRFVGALDAAGGAWGDLARQLHATRDRLMAAPPERPVDPATGVLDDRVLRAAVRARDTPAQALVVDELGIGAGAADSELAVRADVAVLTPSCWTGVELKGERDTLTRLPRQVRAYSATFDRCELVTTTRHVDATAAALPPWWALTQAVPAPAGGVRLETVRVGGVNPDADPFARAQLLWRAEALTLLRTVGVGAGMSSATRDRLRQALVAQVGAMELRELVTAALQARLGWLADDGAGRVGLPGTRR